MKRSSENRTAARAALVDRDPRPSGDRVAAIIVTYHPDPSLVDRIAPLLGQVGGVLIVDNGSAANELAPLRSLVVRGEVEMIENGSNLGVGEALNLGLEWAERRAYPWALTLDQDTIPGPNIIFEAGRVFDAIPVPPPAVISAGWGGGWPVSDPGGPITCAITAGALHSVAAWLALGGFRADFFIDYVDTEFSLRARANGYGVLGVRRETISHLLGRPTEHATPFRSFRVANHDRMRRYYITRNRIEVWRRYARLEPRYVARDIKVAIKEFPKIVLFEDDRLGKLGAMARGLIDGLRGVSGRSKGVHH